MTWPILLALVLNFGAFAVNMWGIYANLKRQRRLDGLLANVSSAMAEAEQYLRESRIVAAQLQERSRGA